MQLQKRRINFVSLEAIQVPIRCARPKTLNKLKRNDIFDYDFRGIWGINMEIRSDHR
jgi:hypothetical protein